MNLNNRYKTYLTRLLFIRDDRHLFNAEKLWFYKFTIVRIVLKSRRNEYKPFDLACFDVFSLVSDTFDKKKKKKKKKR